MAKLPSEILEHFNNLQAENDRFKKALIKISKMREVGLNHEYVINKYSEYAEGVLNGKNV